MLNKKNTHDIGCTPLFELGWNDPNAILAITISANAIWANSHFGQFSLVSMRIAGIHNINKLALDI